MNSDLEKKEFNTNSRSKRKKSNNCCIFVSMVSIVLVIFILYVSSHLGLYNKVQAMEVENFTISDALIQPPPQMSIVNNLQNMAEIISQPNQFMAKGKTKFTETLLRFC